MFSMISKLVSAKAIKVLGAVAAAGIVGLAATPAQAGGRVSFGVSFGGYGGPGYAYSPVYYRPAPVYYAPAPVVYTPQPVYYSTTATYYTNGYYATPYAVPAYQPVYYSAPAYQPYYSPYVYPTFSFGFGYNSGHYNRGGYYRGR